MVKKVVHTYTVKLLKDAGLFKFVWPFGTTHYERLLFQPWKKFLKYFLIGGFQLL